jgi:hypothetical protein
VGFDSLELGVSMQRWDSTALNWVEEWFDSLELCRGGVRKPLTECGHAEVRFDSLELGVGCRGGFRQP